MQPAQKYDEVASTTLERTERRCRRLSDAVGGTVAIQWTNAPIDETTADRRTRKKRWSAE